MSRTRSIDLTSNQRAEVLALLNRCIPDTEVWAYGSRIKFTAKPHSDLDLVVFASPEQFRDTIRMNRVVLPSGKTEPAPNLRVL